MDIILLDISVTFVTFTIEEFFRRLYEMGEGDLRRTNEIGGQAVHMSAIFGRAGDHSVMFPAPKSGGNGYWISQAGAE